MAPPSPKSPLAPARFPDLPVIAGVQLATAAAGVKYQGRDDVLLAFLAPGTSVAGVFTRSSTRSAPVLDAQSKIGGDPSRGAAFLVNSGNANAFTGGVGTQSVTALTQAVAEATGVPVARVFTASTGVIGERLAHERIIDRLANLQSGLQTDGFEAAAQAIMTTDTFPKGAWRQVELGGRVVSIAGIVKGSGMIAPDMATMLGFVFTDAKLDQADLQTLVEDATPRTFNAITVDSDTSTSDTVLVAATGASGVEVGSDPAFAEALEDVMRELAQLVVRDGEGASKFVEVVVTGAHTDADAKTHALSIANSPLVKTAIAGEDPNWGRVVMAIGKSGAAADRDLLSIWFGDVLVAEKGWVHPDYREADGAEIMKQSDLRITVDLGLGAGASRVWTCDLTHGYIEINADYRS